MIGPVVQGTDIHFLEDVFLGVIRSSVSLGASLFSPLPSRIFFSLYFGVLLSSVPLAGRILLTLFSLLRSFLLSVLFLCLCVTLFCLLFLLDGTSLHLTVRENSRRPLILSSRSDDFSRSFTFVFSTPLISLCFPLVSCDGPRRHL